MDSHFGLCHSFSIHLCCLFFCFNYFSFELVLSIYRKYLLFVFFLLHLVLQRLVWSANIQDVIVNGKNTYFALCQFIFHSSLLLFFCCCIFFLLLSWFWAFTESIYWFVLFFVLLLVLQRPKWSNIQDVIVNEKNTDFCLDFIFFVISLHSLLWAVCLN